MQNVKDFEKRVKVAGLSFVVKKSDKICPIHKTQMVYTDKSPQPFCIKCQREAVEKEKKTYELKAQRDVARRYLKAHSLVDNADQYNCTFSTFKAQKGSKEANVGNMAYKLAQEYIQKPNEPITALMYGTPGEGKSHLAMAMLNEINDKSQPSQHCLFIDVSRLFNKWTDGFGRKGTEWNDEGIKELLGQPRNKRKYIGGTDVLVLDDLGSETTMRSDITEASDRKQDILKGILDVQPRVIITTNLTFEELKKVYNPKIISRLLWHSKGHQLDFSGIQDKRY